MASLQKKVMEDEKISVIIPTKNRKQDVIKCLESIMIQSMLPDEIVIVDSSDTEELKYKCDLLSQCKIPIKCFHIKASATAARNIGSDLCIGDILFFVDDDVILDKEYIKNIMYVFDNDLERNVGGVIGEIIGNMKQDELIKKIFRLYSQTLATFFFLTKYGDGKFQPSGFPTVIRLGSVSKIAKIEYLCGCCIAIRKNAFDEIRFDEKLAGGWWGDDDDLAYRLSKKYQNIYVPQAKLIHNASPVRVNNYSKMNMLIWNHYYLFKKNLPQDFKHKFAFYWSVVGLFIQEGVMMLIKRNSSGLRGLASGMIYVIKSKKSFSGDTT